MTLIHGETPGYTETPEFVRLKSDVVPSTLPPWSINSSYHPSDKELALLASHAYTPQKPLRDLSLDQEWVILATYAVENGYDGAAYWHEGKRQLVISHRGTEPPLPANEAQPTVPRSAWWNLFGKLHQYAGEKVQTAKDVVRRGMPTVKDLITDYTGVAASGEVEQIESTLEFAQTILSQLKNKNVISYSVTGHSLGGWLAQITAYEFTRSGNIRDSAGFSADIHCVVFESPGAKRIIEISEQHTTADHKLNLNTDLDITTYLSAPNLVNTCHQHLGAVYRIFPNFSHINTSTVKGWGEYLLHAHTIDNFCRFFTESTSGFPVQLKKVIKWPQIDWMQMEISKLSVIHGLWRFSTGRSTGVEAFLATLADLDYTQYEAIAEICKVDINTEEYTFKQLYNMARQGHYEVRDIAKNNELLLPARGFGSHYRQILSGLQAYQVLVQSDLLGGSDIDTLNQFKTLLKQKLSDNISQLEALTRCLSFDEQTSVLKLNIASCCEIFNITADEANRPALWRYFECQLIQVSRSLFRAYPALAEDLHRAYLGIPSQLLNNNLALRNTLEKLEKEMDKLKSAEKEKSRDPQLRIENIIKGTVGEAGLEMGNASNIPHDKELLERTFQQQKEVLNSNMNHKMILEETGIINNLKDKLFNWDFASPGNQPTTKVQEPPPAEIIIQFNSPIGERLFLRRANGYHDALEKEEDKDIVKMRGKLKDKVDAYEKHIEEDTVSEAQRKSNREGIRKEIKDIEEMKEEVKKELERRKKANC